MALFRYEAIDKTGKVVRGVMNASDEQQVAQNLTAMGYAPRGVYAPSGTASTQSSAGMQAVTLASGLPVSIKSKVPISQLAMFFRQLVTLVRSGIPLYQSFVDLAPAMRDRRLRQAIPVMQQTLQSGQPLSSAMSAFPHLFPAHAIASVWCGELSGKLDIVLEEVASDFEAEAADTRIGRFGWALFKVNLIFLILSLPAYNMTNLVQPVLGDAPGDIEKANNLSGTFLRGILSDVVRKSIPIAAVVLAAWVIWGYIKRVPAVRRLIDGALLRVPIWGKLHRYRSASRFLHMLDMLYAAGVSPGRAWEAASITPRNSEIAEKLRLSRVEGAQTAGITELSAVSNVLEPEDVSLISAGERTGQLPATLSKLSSVYADRAAAQKPVCRLLSVSLMNAALIAMSGAAIIVVAKTYVGPMLDFMGK